ncbi:tetratricopeptide repeat protein [Flavobacterium faecale]|uniref:tetratricopeptide repeat protein n=1 Tax=Flavobacterium faecale TaxID=1355330 RepID=UPI003AAAC340
MMILIILIGIVVISIVVLKEKSNKKTIISKNNNFEVIKADIKKLNLVKDFNVNKLNRIEIDEIVGFIGITNFSPNNLFGVSCNPGYNDNDKWFNGKIAVFNNKKLLFKKDLKRPNNCALSNNGVTICCDWLSSDKLSGKFYVFDINGNEIFHLETQANLGSCCISENGEISVFETYNSDNEDGNNLFIIDIAKGSIINKIKKPISFSKAIINTEVRTIELISKSEFIFEIDFDGQQVNLQEYKKKLLDKGSTNDILLYYSNLPNEIKFQDEDYLAVLEKATKNGDSFISLRNEKVYREIGDFYEVSGYVERAIKYWQKAIEINPKVGIKKKLNKYKANL